MIKETEPPTSNSGLTQCNLPTLKIETTPLPCTHTLSPIFWPTKRRREGWCVCVCVCAWFCMGYGRVALESWLIQLSHNCSCCLKFWHPETRIPAPFFRKYLAFPMAPSGELLCKVRKNVQNRKARTFQTGLRKVATTGKHVNLLIYGRSEKSLADSLMPQAGKSVWTESASTRSS